MVLTEEAVMTKINSWLYYDGGKAYRRIEKGLFMSAWHWRKFLEEQILGLWFNGWVEPGQGEAWGKGVLGRAFAKCGEREEQGGNRGMELAGTLALSLQDPL